MKQKTLIEKETLLPFWLLGSTVISAVLHNLIYALFQIEEAIFFLATLLLFLGFFASVIYNVLLYLNKGKPTDIWKLGWLGLFGLLGLIGNPGFYGFFGFFGFFGMRKK